MLKIGVFSGIFLLFISVLTSAVSIEKVNSCDGPVTSLTQWKKCQEKNNNGSNSVFEKVVVKKKSHGQSCITKFDDEGKKMNLLLSNGRVIDGRNCIVFDMNTRKMLSGTGGVSGDKSLVASWYRDKTQW